MSDVGGHYGPETYGDRFAEVYDEWYQGLTPDMEGAASFLAALARSGRALELGIGTGRVALPLAERGVTVHGIDASEAMVARLRAKPGGTSLPVEIGDFADVAVEGSFSLIFVAFCTFFALLSQDEQVRCFANVAERLDEDGVFVIEAFGASYPAQFKEGQRAAVGLVDAQQVILDLGRYDPATQRASLQYVLITDEGTRLYPMQLRYTSPPELDLMARLAGLRLRERWAGWRREAFTAESTLHVSVYERVPE